MGLNNARSRCPWRGHCRCGAPSPFTSPTATTNPKFICINQPIKAFCQQVRLARTCPDRAFPLMPMRRAQPTAQPPYPHKSKRLALASLSPNLFTPFMQVARPLSRRSPLIKKQRARRAARYPNPFPLPHSVQGLKGRKFCE